MRVVVADDHALLREGLSGLLNSVNTGWRIDQAGTLQEATAYLDDGDVDLLVIDLQMPGMDGANTLSRLRVLQPTLKIAVLTATEDRAMILNCLAAGVHGYILKLDATEELLSAIKLILEGGVYVPAALSRVMRDVPVAPTMPVPGLSVPGASQMPVLTSRQHDVMTLLAEGLSTKMIARRLSLGVGTVKVHLSALYRALDVHTRMEAVVKAGSLIEGK